MLDIWNRVYSTEILNLIEQDDREQLKPTYDRIRKLCINSLYKYKTTEQRNIIMNEFVNYYTTEGGWNELNQTKITRVGLEAQANGNNKEQAEETERTRLAALPEEEKKKSIYSYFLKEEETFQRGPNDYKNDNDDKIKYMTISCPTCIEAANSNPLTNSFYELRKANRMDNLRCHCNACQTDFNGYTGSEIKNLPEPVEREIMIAIGSGKNNIYPTFVDAFRRYDLEIQQAQGRLFSIPRATLSSILLAREGERRSKAEQEMFILKGQMKECPNTNCRKTAIHENGCSQMNCSEREGGCGTEWCYICGEATAPGEGHDPRHFLMNLDPPFGSFFALQCCNVNWTIKGIINGEPGPNNNYKQVVSFSSHDERSDVAAGGDAPLVPSTFDRYQQVSINKATKEARGERLTRDEEIEYDKIYGYWIKTQVLYRKFTHINKPINWWADMCQGITMPWAGNGIFQGLDTYYVIGDTVYDSDPMIGFSEMTLQQQNDLLDRVLAAYPNDKIARLKRRLNSINDQIQNAPQDDDGRAIVDIQAIQQNESDEAAGEVMAQGQQYQVPPEGLRHELVQMLGAAPNVPGNMIERIIQQPLQQHQEVVMEANPPMNDADLAQIMEALDDEFNPAEAAVLALEMDANRGPAVDPAAVPAAVPDQGNDLGLNPGELQDAMEQQQIVDQGGVDGVRPADPVIRERLIGNEPEEINAVDDVVDEFVLNPDERQDALELQQFFEQAQREAAQREAAPREAAQREAQAQQAVRRRQVEDAEKNRKYAFFKRCFAQIQQETEPIVRRENGEIIEEPREGRPGQIERFQQSPVNRMNELLQNNHWLVDRLGEEGWYHENRGYVTNDRNIYVFRDWGYGTRIKARDDIEQERLAPVMLEWEQQLAARAAAVEGPIEGPIEEAAAESRRKWQALIEELNRQKQQLGDDEYRVYAIDRAIEEAQTMINQNEPYPNFNNNEDEASGLTLHLNTLFMCGKIVRLGLPIVKIHFCKYTARPQDQVDRDRRYGGFGSGFGNGLPRSDDYHLLFEVNDGRFAEYNDEENFIERPRQQGQLYPEIELQEAVWGSCYTIEVSDGTDIHVVYNILKSIFTKYRALNDNYGNMIQLFVDIYNYHGEQDLLTMNNLQTVFYEIQEQQRALRLFPPQDLGGGSGNKRRKVTKKRKNRVYVSGKKNKNNSRKK